MNRLMILSADVVFIYLFIYLFIHETNSYNSLQNGHKKAQRVLLAHRQLQGQATDAAP